MASLIYKLINHLAQSPVNEKLNEFTEQVEVSEESCDTDETLRQISHELCNLSQVIPSYFYC